MDRRTTSTRKLVRFWRLYISIAAILAIGAVSARGEGRVLILGSTVSGGASSLEAQRAIALGFQVDVVSNQQWQALNTADFATYRAIILGDPNCVYDTSALAAAENTVGVWGPAITGNVVIIGSDPVFHHNAQRIPGAQTLVQSGIAFATADADQTGAYITLSCYYHGTTPFTPVRVLDAFVPGGFTVTGVGCFDDAHIVAAHPALAGLTDAALSNWICSVHEAFDTWPSAFPVVFKVLAIAENIGSSYTAPDGTVGTPYIICRGCEVISGIDLQPRDATRSVGAQQILSATVTADSAPVPGVTVGFEVIGGPHVGVTGAAITGIDGVAAFRYAGSTVGVDTLHAQFTDSLGQTQTSDPVLVRWVPAPTITCPGAVAEPCDPDGVEAQLVARVEDSEERALEVTWSVNGTVRQMDQLPGGVPPTTVDVPFSYTYRPGVHTVIARVTDETGGSAECGTTTTIIDSEVPSTTCPPDRSTIVCVDTTIPDLRQLETTDNCSPRTELDITQSPAPAIRVGPGSHDITIEVRDEAQNVAVCNTRLTVDLDTTEPVVSDIQVFPALVTALIQWTTDEPSTTQLEYGLTSEYGQSSPFDPVLRTVHEVRLSGLTPDTTYHFKTECRDVCGYAVVSPDQLFTTLPAPNLRVSELVTPQGGLTGQAFSVRWTVENNGHATAALPWSDRVFVSPDAQFGNGNDFPLLTSPAPTALAQGTSYDRITTPSLPGSPGDYWIIVVTDVQNEVLEISEADNVAVSVIPIHVEQTPIPDLTILSVTPPSDHVLSGSTVQVTYMVKNLGNGPTETTTWTDGIYLSTNPGQLGNLIRDVGNPQFLLPDGSYAQTVDVQLPQDVTGTYYVGIQTDRTGRVSEFHENNNTLVSGGFIVDLAPQPDLIAEGIAFSSKVFSGQDVTLTWVDRNQGEGATDSGSWTDAVYFSRNDSASIEPGDILLGSASRSGAPLQPGQTDASRSLTKFIPPNLEGQFFVKVRVDANNQVSEFGAEGNNVAVSTGRINVILSVSVDLIPTAVGGPSSGIPGHNVQVSWSAENTCAEPEFALSWNDKIYLSPDAQFGNENDRLIGSAAHGTVANCPGCPGGSLLLDPYTNTRSFRLPDDLAAGDYFVLVVVDADNTVFEGGCPNGENNNVLASTATIHVTLVPTDLTIEVNFDGGHLLPTSAAASQEIRVSWRVTNIGLGVTPVNVWQDRVYLSGDPNLGGDTLLGSATYSSGLAPGGSYVTERTMRVPFVGGGAYYLLFVTDAGGDVYEQPPGENNNVASTPFTVASDAPDLTILDPVVPEHARSGQPVLFEWTVVNNGTLPTNVNTWVDQVYLSVDAVPGGALSLCSMTHSGALGVGQSYRASLSCALPINLSGLFHVIKRTDVQNAVFETNENNNVIVKPMLIDVELTDPANLIVSSVNAAEAALSGQTLEVTWTVENTGAGPTNVSSWSDSVYLSRDSFLDPGFDLFLGSVSYQGFLAPGQSYTQIRTLGIPFGVSGPYFVIVVTDSGNQVFENQNEGDNVGVDPELTMITIPPPSDLIVGPTITPPASGVLGEPATFSWEITNAGAEVVNGSWQDSVYLSADEVWDIGDRRVGTFTRIAGILNPGEPTTVTGSAPIPAVLPGSYHVIVRADVFNQIPETNELNNLGTSLTTLAVTAMPLQLGVPHEGSLAVGEDKYFELELPAGMTVRIALEHEDPDAWTEMYVRLDDVPTLGQFDFIFGSPGQSSQEVLIPTSSAGTYYIMIKGVVGSNSPHMRLLAEELSFGITSYEPKSGGDSGYVTIAIHGAQFDAECIAKLEQGDAAIPSNVYFIDGSLLLAEFDLQGASRGTYNLVVRCSGDRRAIAFPGFTIVAGFRRLSVTIEGFDSIRSTTINRFTTFVRNIGNVDGDYVLITGSVPNRPSISMHLAMLGHSIGGLPAASLDYHYATPDGIMSAAIAPFLPPNAQAAVPMDITASESESSFILNAGAIAIQEGDLDLLLEDTLTWGDSDKGSLKAVRAIMRTSILDPSPLFWTPVVYLLVVVGAVYFGAPITIAASLAAVISAIFNWGPTLWEVTRLADFIQTQRRITVVRPADPNEKQGPPGFGAERFIGAHRALNYKVFFENLPSATAPASRVVITDALDASLNIGLFRLSRIRFGETVVDVPENRISYQTRIDLRSTRGVFVDITAGVNAGTREAFWIFHTIDPETGEPPIDAQKGFLPPNATSPEGEGVVEYTIKPTSNVATGTIIHNSAAIVFDREETIHTNEVFNTVDEDPPSSAVGALPAAINDTVVQLTWSGEDAPGGSGLAAFSIYVSTDGGSFVPFESNTADVAAVFQGQPGRTYAFYSVAIDNAGNSESAPPVPDAVTVLVIPPPAAPLMGTVTATTVALQDVGTAATFEAAVQDEVTGFFVGVHGRLSDVPAWRLPGQWSGEMVRALAPETEYRFKSKVRISPESESLFGPTVTIETSVQGDCDGDGAITQTDVGIVQAALQTQFGQPGFDARADLDGDDEITFADFGIVQLALVRKGDYNDNGIVDLEDFSVFSTCVAGPGPVPPFDDCPALSDFDLDGDVDLHDVALFLRVFRGP